MMDPALVHKIIYQRLMDLCHQLLCLAVTPLTLLHREQAQQERE